MKKIIALALTVLFIAATAYPCDTTINCPWLPVGFSGFYVDFTDGSTLFFQCTRFQDCCGNTVTLCNQPNIFCPTSSGPCLAECYWIGDRC